MSVDKSYARLSRSKSKSPFQPILCSQCHYQFGFVVDSSRAGPFPPNIPEEAEPRKIYLWGGWRLQPVNGVVSLTKYALERLRDGKVPRYRRRRFEEAAEYLAYSPEYDLPVVLLCPQCGERQTLDKERLNADRVYEADGIPRVMKASREQVGRRRP